MHIIIINCRHLLYKNWSIIPIIDDCNSRPIVFGYRKYYFITFDDHDDTTSKKRIAHIYNKL